MTERLNWIELNLLKSWMQCSGQHWCCDNLLRPPLEGWFLSTQAPRQAFPSLWGQRFLPGLAFVTEPLANHTYKEGQIQAELQSRKMWCLLQVGVSKALSLTSLKQLDSRCLRLYPSPLKSLFLSLHPCKGPPSLFSQCKFPSAEEEAKEMHHPLLKLFLSFAKGKQNDQSFNSCRPQMRGLLT